MPTVAISGSGGVKPASSEFEHAGDTASDYDSYDEVARDRRAGG